MNLGLGMAAANAFVNAQQQDEVRQRERERYAAEKQRTDAELSLLGDRTTSQRETYRDTIGAAQARQQLRPGETANAIGRQRVDAGNIATDEATAPDRRAAAVSGAQVNAGLAQARAANLPAITETQTNTDRAAAVNSRTGLTAAQFTERELPAKLDQMYQQRVISQDEQRDAVLGRIARKLKDNDINGALSFAGHVAGHPDLLPETNGERLTAIEPVRDGVDKFGTTGPGYIFKTETGKSGFISHQSLAAAERRLLGNPKFHFMHDNYGMIAVGNERDGTVNVLSQGNAALRAAAGNSNLPAEGRMFQFWKSQGYSNAEAEQRVRSLKEKSEKEIAIDMYNSRVRNGGLLVNTPEARKKIMDEAKTAAREFVQSYESKPPAASAPTSAAPAPATQSPSPGNWGALIGAPGAGGSNRQNEAPR